MLLIEKRSSETQKAYDEFLESGTTADFVTEPALKDFTHWKVIINDFPYDNIASVHHMLVPKRKVSDEKLLTDAEREELIEIKEQLSPDYDMFIESSRQARTVKGHFHIHLIG